MFKKLLIEIFLEEMPAKPLIKNIQSIENIWHDILVEHNLLEKTQDSQNKINFFYTPERLILEHQIKEKSPDIETLQYGCPKNMAFENGSLSPIAKSFLKKFNADEKDLQIMLKNDKEVIALKTTQNGQFAKDILPDLINAWLKKINFGKSMRWGDGALSFIRPIRNAMILLDNHALESSIFDIKTTNKTYIWNDAKLKSIKIDSVDLYHQALLEHKIIIDQEKRKNIILDEIKNIESNLNFKVNIDENLLEEIIALTSMPKCLVGHFDEVFLNLPQELIITSMMENQKYFSTHKNGKLFNAFIVVANTKASNCDAIIKGNQKVLSARLKDAEFFYQNDIKMKMDFGSLDKIGFLQNAGSLKNKINREIRILDILFESLNANQKNTLNLENLKQALNLAKNDLNSQVVKEFANLQGIMGAIYAKKENINDDICMAIKEQYLPNGENNALPSSLFSALVNIAIKLDTIATIFSLNMIPSGSKDPFALRRAGIAILKICDIFDLRIDLFDILQKIKESNKQNFDISLVINFIKDRFYAILFDINPSIVRCVIDSNIGENKINSANIKDIFNKIRALNEYFLSNNIKSFISTFKRLANVSNNAKNDVKIDESLFSNIEKEIYDYIKNYQKMQFDTFKDSLNHLFNIKEKLDILFDTTLINDSNEELKNNRIKLIQIVENEFLVFGDLKEISV